MSQKKITDWCVTFYDNEEVIAIRPYCSYIVVGEEICPDTGRLHYQSFIQLKTPRTLKQLKVIIPTAHLESRRGSVEEAMAYCMKDGVFHQEGQVKDHPGQGFRTDLENFMEDAKELDRASMYAKHCDAMIRYRNAYDDVKSTFAKPRPNGTPIYWIFGPPGCGKSTIPSLSGASLFDKHPEHHWWCGYNGEGRVRIDEITPKVPFNDLLKIGDPGVLRLQVKGGTAIFASDAVFITSNLHPQQVYQREADDRDLWEALLRRVRFYKCRRLDDAGRSAITLQSYEFDRKQFTEVVPLDEQEFNVPLRGPVPLLRL